MPNPGDKRFKRLTKQPVYSFSKIADEYMDLVKQKREVEAKLKALTDSIPKGVLYAHSDLSGRRLIRQQYSRSTLNMDMLRRKVSAHTLSACMVTSWGCWVRCSVAPKSHTGAYSDGET